MATHNRGVVDSFKGRVIELDKGKLIRDEAEGEYQAKDQKSNIKSQKENKDA